MTARETTRIGLLGEMSSSTFAQFRELIHRLSGIALSEGKEGLVRARVSKRMRALGILEYDEYLERVVADCTGEEIVNLLDVISTNVTSFFREERHFQVLAETARTWLAERRTNLRLWSAACSTGEEPYSMAMTLLPLLEGGGVDLKILATDLSTRALDRARSGRYEGDKLRGVPPEHRTRFFADDPNHPSTLNVAPELRRAVVFARLNLSQVPFPMSGPFDAVFCRNVMIYFDVDIRRRLLAEILRLLRPGGWLFVGHSESLMGLTSGFKSVSASVYVKS